MLHTLVRGNTVFENFFIRLNISFLKNYLGIGNSGSLLKKDCEISQNKCVMVISSYPSRNNDAFNILIAVFSWKAFNEKKMLYLD